MYRAKKENKAPVMLFKVFLYSNYAIEMENDINWDHRYLPKYICVIHQLSVKTEGTGFPEESLCPQY